MRYRSSFWFLINAEKSWKMRSTAATSAMAHAALKTRRRRTARHKEVWVKRMRHIAHNGTTEYSEAWAIKLQVISSLASAVSVRSTLRSMLGS